MEPEEYVALMKVLRGQQKLMPPDENSPVSGPPSPKEYSPQPIEGREQERPETFRDVVKDIAPVLMAQALDGLSTEISTRQPTRSNESGLFWQSREANPLPGMGSTLGRLGWGALENVALHLLRKKNPRLGKIASTAAIIGSSGLARGNFHTVDETEPYRKVVHPFLVNK